MWCGVQSAPQWWLPLTPAKLGQKQLLCCVTYSTRRPSATLTEETRAVRGTRGPLALWPEEGSEWHGAPLMPRGAISLTPMLPTPEKGGTHVRHVPSGRRMW